MRALRVVGITEGRGVPSSSKTRSVASATPCTADERLRAAARGDLTRLGQIAIELESQLRPREIQARIRAGASVEQVATAAGVPQQKIERFAYPVLLERSRTAERRPARPPDARRRAGQPHARRGRRPHVRAARPGLRRRRVGLVEGRRRPLGRRAVLARRPFGQPGALDVPARGARRHRHRARRARERPGRGPAGAPAADGRPGDRHGPAGRRADPGPADRCPSMRAAASEGGRRGPEPAYPSYDRAPTRTAPEPRRPAPPAQRQAPVEPRPAEPRPAQGYAAPPGAVPAAAPGARPPSRAPPTRPTEPRSTEPRPEEQVRTAEPGPAARTRQPR